MKNRGPVRKLRFGTIWDRIIAALLFAVFAGLVYLASIGYFDEEINRAAAWLQRLVG